MSNNYDPLDLDPEEQDWMKQKKQAAARRDASRQQAPQLNPPVLTEAEHDAHRKTQALKDQAAIRAANVTPATLAGGGDPLELDLKIHRPVPIVAPPVATPVVVNATDLCFWVCEIPDNDYGHSEKLYASNWEELKNRLKAHTGSFKAFEHKFKNSPEAILGFFCPNQYPPPANTIQKTFEIIVQQGRVFRDES